MFWPARRGPELSWQAAAAERARAAATFCGQPAPCWSPVTGSVPKPEPAQVLAYAAAPAEVLGCSERSSSEIDEELNADAPDPAAPLLPALSRVAAAPLRAAGASCSCSSAGRVPDPNPTTRCKPAACAYAAAGRCSSAGTPADVGMLSGSEAPTPTGGEAFAELALVDSPFALDVALGELGQLGPDDMNFLQDLAGDFDTSEVRP